MPEPSTQLPKSEVEAALSKLSLDTSNSPAKPAQKKSKMKKSSNAVADSWEDEDISSSSSSNSDGEDGEMEQQSQGKGQSQSTPLDATSPFSTPNVPSPPPPTPISPPSGQDTGSPGRQYPERRPEKTDAVARRMIAAGLGLKVPKQTAEQKEYQRSIREQERKRRDKERAEEQRRKDEAERAKAAVWED